MICLSFKCYFHHLQSVYNNPAGSKTDAVQPRNTIVSSDSHGNFFAWMEPARRTTSPEGADDVCLNDLNTVQLLLPPGDSASPELAIEASSYPCIHLDQDLDQHLLNYSLLLPSTPELAIDGSSSPNIDWAALDKIPLYIDTCLEVATIDTCFAEDLALCMDELTITLDSMRCELKFLSSLLRDLVKVTIHTSLFFFFLRGR